MRWLSAVILFFAVWGHAEAAPSIRSLPEPTECPSCPTNHGGWPVSMFTEANPDALSGLSKDRVTQGARPRVFGVPTSKLFQYVAFMAVVVSGIMGARITLVAGRGPYAITAHPLLGLIANLSVMVSLAWGFVVLPWYWPLIAFGVATVVSALTVNNGTLLPLLGARRAIDILTIVGAVVLWWKFADL